MVRIPGSPALSNDVANNVSILCILWFSASVVGTLCNKHIMKDWKYPVIVSFLHLLCSVVLDSVFLTYKKEVRTDATLSLVASTLPIALLMGMSKFLTYYSYGLIPISLAHTVKSSSSIFSMIVSYVLFKQLPNSRSLIAVFLIACGVALSAVTELEMNSMGFIAVLLSACVSALQSGLFKRLLGHEVFTPLQIHLCISSIALAISLPSAVVYESDVLFSDIPFQLLLVSIAMAYVQTLASMYVLSHVSVTTHAVLNTFKRLIVIVLSILHFGNPVSWSNCLGMAIALLGFFSYGLSQSRRRSRILSDDFDSYDLAPSKEGNRSYLPMHSIPQDSPLLHRTMR